MKRSTVVAANSNKSIFGQNGPYNRKLSTSAVPYESLNFNDFFSKYSSIYGDYKYAPSFEFLSWFVGFYEGDGSFLADKEGKRLRFVVAQDTRDIQVIYTPQRLGFGSVMKWSGNISAFVVSDTIGIYLVCSIFNGNLVSRSKWEKFKNFLLAFNKYSNTGRLKFEEFNLKYELATDGWFSGFTDAMVGCFFVSIEPTKTGYTVRLRFSINQHSNEILLVKSFVTYLNCGRVSEERKNPIARFEITKLSDLAGKLLPVSSFFYFVITPYKNKKDKVLIRGSSSLNWPILFPRPPEGGLQ